eukprot:INCI12214.1.p1 GENE.INCI12214.1~~INCI12214.1.p1  ORF type:complete len:431 (-),score=59.53 INCI12214.1:144-1436(-)
MASLGTKGGILLAFYLLGTSSGRLAVRSAAARLGLAAPVELNKPSKDMHFHGYEFGGPAGSMGMLLGLPVGVFSLIWAARQDSLGAALGGIVEAVTGALADFSLEKWLPSSALNIVVGWFGFQVLLERLLPGKWVDGCPMPPKFKESLPYKVNGHAAFWASLLAVGVGQYTGLLKLQAVYDMYPQIAAAAIAFSALLSVHLYLSSFLKGKLLAEGGTSKNWLYNFFMGRELNPRIGTFDLKYFCELRPGLIGWTIINIAMAVKQYHMQGYVSAPMYLVTALQGLYTWDALYYESAILSTMDITTEGFGFMLAMGDLGWVPFTYSLQALYLVEHDPGMPTWYYGLVAAFGALAYAAFRGSNGQKDRFRRLYKSNPELFDNLESMPTKRGTRLITGGWWGICRKINYTADISMALSWSLCTGGAILPYFYPM